MSNILANAQLHTPQSMLQKPLVFIENKGQIKDQFGMPRTDIQYCLAASNGLNLFIGSGNIKYQFKKSNSIINHKHKNVIEKCIIDTPVKCDMYRVDINLVGANPKAKIITEEKQAYYENYYIAPLYICKDNTAYSYKRITYQNIYPNIDWSLYIKKNKLEYDFIVHPGGNPNDIKIQYNGATNLQTNKDGISATTPLGQINESSPICYEKLSKKIINSKIQLTNNVIHFKIPEYEGTLVIDPTIDWATYFGCADVASNVICDSTKNVYIEGHTSCSIYIATIGVYQSTIGGMNDAFLSKFDSSGSPLWATYYGGSGLEEAYGLACDGYGNIFITGITTSTDSIATSGAYQTNYGISEPTYNSVFLAKFNTSGFLQWATYYGGSGRQDAYGCCCDKMGNVYITGCTTSNDSIATSSSYLNTIRGEGAIFLAKFSTTGSMLWATYFGGSGGALGGSGNETGNAVVCDASSNVYITGITSSRDSVATIGAYQTVLSSLLGGNAFIAKFDSSGILKWGTYYGSNGSSVANGITCDGYNNIYIAGHTNCTDSIATPGGHRVALGGGFSGFLAKFGNTGNIEWGTYFGDGGQCLSSDGQNNIYLVGGTQSAFDIATPDGYEPNFSGNTNGFLVQFNIDGELIWGTYFGNGPLEPTGATGVTNDKIGNVYIAGGTGCSEGIATPNAYDTAYHGDRLNGVAFLAKFKGFPIPNSVKEINTSHSFTLSPNPTKGDINIIWAGITLQEAQLSIFNMQGQVLITQNYPPTQKSANINISNLALGLYICSLQCGEQTYYNKFTVIR